MAEQRNPDADLVWGLADIKRRLDDYALWDRYIEGDQDMALTSKRWRSTFGHIASALVLNLCPSVVGAVADRLGVAGFTAPEGNEPDDDEDEDDAPPARQPLSLEERATKAWGPTLQVAEDQVTDDALTYGDGFMLVDLDPTTRKATYWPQNPSQCAVRYSTERIGEVVCGIKVWADGSGRSRRYRANVYYGDLLFRYVTKGKHQSCPDKLSAFRAYDDDPGVYPVEANPTGVCPMFHFPRGGRIGGYGVSVLRVVKPVQDALNKQVLDIVVGSEYVALPQRYATGVGGDDDLQAAARSAPDPVTGARKPRFRPGIDRMWTTTNKDAQFGEFPGADLSRLIPVANFYKVSAAQISGIPGYYMMLQGGEAPSGEARKTEDARLVKQVQRLSRQWGPTYVMMLLTGFALEDQKPVDLTQNTGLTCEWENPEIRNNKEDAEVALLKQDAGVSRRRSLMEIGYTPEDIEEFEEEADKEAQVALAAGMAAMQRAAVGGFPPVGPGDRQQPPPFAAT